VTFYVILETLELSLQVGVEHIVAMLGRYRSRYTVDHRASSNR